MGAAVGNINQLHYLETDALAIAEQEDLRPPEQHRRMRVPVEISAIPFSLYDAAATPEQKLLIATLDDAVMTILRHANAADRRGVRLREEDLTWIRMRRIGKVTFEQCCAALGCDPGAVEDGVLRHLAGLRERGEHRKFKRSMHLVKGDR